MVRQEVRVVGWITGLRTGREALPALPEDLGSVPSTHMATQSCLLLQFHLHIFGGKYIHINLFKKKNRQGTNELG